MEGYVIYQGLAGESVNYFAKYGYQCPEYANPADYFLREFSVPKVQDESYFEKIRSLSENYNISALQQMSTEYNSVYISYDKKKDYDDFSAPVSWFTELRMLMYRTFLDVLRNSMLMRLRV